MSITRIIKRIFGIKSKPRFTIQYFPYTKKYAVKYKNKGWLSTRYHTGVVYVETLFDIADFYHNENDAIDAINKFKEQRFRECIAETEIE